MQSLLMDQKLWNGKRVAVLGGGKFGMVLASVLARKVEELALWLQDDAKAKDLQMTRVTHIFQTEFRIPENVRILTGYTGFSEGEWLLCVAVPSRELEEVLEGLHRSLSRDGDHIILLFSKGVVSAPLRRKFGATTYSRLMEQWGEDGSSGGTGRPLRLRIAAANGPSLSSEMYASRYTFLNIGCRDDITGNLLAELFRTAQIQVSVTEDIIGVELGGVLKNPISIAVGIASRLAGAGHNLEGDLIAIGFSEMLRLGMALGAREETLMGRSGLADLITSSISPASRNRKYGERFMEKLFTGENRPGLIQRIELYFNPTRYIEKEALQGQDLAEGIFALSSIVELAKELRIEIPLYTVLYQIITRKAPPEAILGASGLDRKAGKPVVPVAHKKSGLNLASGQNFAELLEKRVYRNITSSHGMQGRIKKQTPHVLSALSRRLEKAVHQKKKSVENSILQERELWKALEGATDEKERYALQKIIQFYVDEISDRYQPGVRETLMRILTPVRSALGGFKRGSAVPHIGGRVDEVRALAGRYNVFYTPTHKSHLDSVEVAFGLTHLGLPVPRYAAGKILMSDPFRSWMLKSMGAYAVDRERTRNILYLECLRHYSTLMLEAGISTLVFPEGTRSRSGGLAPIKTGLLSTAVEAFQNTGSEIIIVPIAISYECIPEDEYFSGVSQSVGVNDFIARRKEVYMDICDPIPVSRHINSESPTLSLAYEVARAWEKNMRILPNHIIARLLMENHYSIEESDLFMLIEDFLLYRNGNYLTRDVGEIAGRGIRILRDRGILETDGETIVGTGKELIQYYGSMAPLSPEAASEPELQT